MLFYHSINVEKKTSRRTALFPAGYLFFVEEKRGGQEHFAPNPIIV